ncbi:redoxin domain-containing protein [Haliangium ochraceum]|uniref:Alkyl hydroperoxide reductase/ Thiol specific antioxidant/ Mal allergen n=1 Tax=Haliangium ochraceum (strain DSM 14365 / JCM 11303 / SMP-2) TaxID=502025 RepID=D0LII6_HALO1|nr:redoxin domain-containing protein [Haliangium ochraceum]ACY18342.1 alkyl hydroperoxide reductase/ Thiol specific antioxidant/ Mal allergen [Haliangium ochraceum DSM 14365]
MRSRSVTCLLGLVALLAAWTNAASAQPAPPSEPWLGVIITPGIRGVHVREVIEDSPADRADLMIGDEILAIGGTAVATPAELVTALSAWTVGSELTATLWRSGRAARVAVVLDAKPGEGEILHRRLVGKQARRFRAPAIGSRGLFDLAGTRGRLVLLAFAGTSCDGCTTLHRTLSRFVDRHASAELSVVAISGESLAVLERWWQNFQPSFVMLRDVDGSVARNYYVNSEPTAVLIARDGSILYIGIGAENMDIALETAERLLSRAVL